MDIKLDAVTKTSVDISWTCRPDAVSYRVYWADSAASTVRYKLLGEVKECTYTLLKSTHVPHYLKVAAVDMYGKEMEWSEPLKTPVGRVFHEQQEKLNRGLVAIPVREGIFVSWRMLLEEVKAASSDALHGTDYILYRNGERIARITDSTNYLDRDGCREDVYRVAPIPEEATEGETTLHPCDQVRPWENAWYDLPLQIPQGGVTPAGESYVYHANDMSVGDIDGDGEYEYFVKWDPSNSHDVSHTGYTGHCLIDCYKLDGTILWRLDLGENIRAGAHYTQFMVYDFNGDGKAEMALKTAPGTCMTRYRPDGSVLDVRYITLPQEDVKRGITHQVSYVCSSQDYRDHLAQMFRGWSERAEVKEGEWPKTLEECFGIAPRYEYPLSKEDAASLTDYFIGQYAPSRSERNHLERFEGFIYEGPEYLTMYAGDGRELETIYFPVPREDDGLRWGDYAMPRIEPCNRVDRFLSGVAYLDGERPYLIICRGYYTRTTLTAYDFFENRFHEVFRVDSGHVRMENPFNAPDTHDRQGSDPVYGALAGQGNHSLAAADVDGDGCMEIIYGAAVIDHDGSLLYSSYDYRPDGVYAKLGHGDAMHVGKFDPDRPGMQIFNVFEGGAAVPYGYALRDAATGKVFFGEYATVDLGRCMVGKVVPQVRGYQFWVNDVYDCEGNLLDVPLLGTNYSIRFAEDLSTQILDQVQYLGVDQPGVVNDNTHGVMLRPENTTTNNTTKGNPCLVADLFGDYREELLLRLRDDSAIRIYMNTELSTHKLFTLMQDTMYRCGVAWQNNCYNQPCYPKYYYATDMDFREVLPQLPRISE